MTPNNLTTAELAAWLRVESNYYFDKDDRDAHQLRTAADRLESLQAENHRLTKWVASMELHFPTGDVECDEQLRDKFST